MRGPKLNEGATVATLERGERHGTKATARYIRSSASKARAVLDLIRGLDVRRADEVLQFTTRDVAKDVRKVLASAVANAVHNDEQDAEELFVLACYADEGPTLRRFAPRARGRATRIRKRTCHITVVVARMSDQRLAISQARAEGVSATAAASRRARVERSRARAQAAKQAAGAPATETADIDATEADETEAIAGVHAMDPAEGKELSEDEVDPAEGSASDEADAARGGSAADDEPAFENGEWEGSVVADEDGNGPETHTIKGNLESMLYHTPESRYYKITKAGVWFDTEEHAEAAGFSKPAAQEADEENN